MARNKGILTNIDNSDLPNYPNGRIKNNSGTGDGTPVNEIVKGDIHEFFDKAMRLYGFTHNGLPDNTANGYQLIDAVIALASKNDFVLDLTTNTGVLNVALRLGKLLDNESFIFKAIVDKTTETEIKGTLDNITKTVSFIGDFKAGEYVRAINTASSVVLVRLADAVNIDTIVSENGYLKKASQVEEDAGAIDTVSTTPLVNKVAFGKRVNDAVESVPYLATALINGIYPKEHFSIVANLGAPERKNLGWFSGIEIGGGNPPGGLLPVSGDILEAKTLSNSPGYTNYTISMDNPMDNTNYFVRMNIEADATVTANGTATTPVFFPINTSQFRVLIGEVVGSVQNLKMHLEVIQL